MKPTGFQNRYRAARAMGVFLVCAMVLAACAVGPQFHAPAAPDVALTPNALPHATQMADGKAQVFASAGDISGDWWHLYHSPELNALINAALANNPTLQASQGTLLAAEEDFRAGQGALFPSLSGSFQDERQKISAGELASFGASQGGGKRGIPPFTLYNASLNVSYSLDIFGGERRQLESLQAQALYERYELEAAYLTLTSNIVTAAVNEASLRAQIDDTNKVVADEQHELKILNVQLNLGGTARANVLSQQAALAQSQATLPPLQEQLAQLRNQLADYVGIFPGDFHAADFTLAALHLPRTIPVSLPSAIVAQRPDIGAAAAQLHEASANLGVADANMLPKITLSAGMGYEALSTGGLFLPQNMLWSLVAGVTQPIFQGGELAAKRRAAVDNLKVAGAQYQGTVIAAFQNVADALAALQYDAASLAAAQAAMDAAAQSLAVTQNAYRLGAQPFTAVLSAQTSYQNAAIAQVKARAARLADTAALFQALGGGWWNRNDVASRCCGIIP